MSCDQIFKILYEHKGAYLDYLTLANLSNINLKYVSHKISRIKRWEGVELGFKYVKKQDKFNHGYITVTLLRCDNKAYIPKEE